MTDQNSSVAVMRVARTGPVSAGLPGWLGPLSDVWEVGVIVLDSDGAVSFASRHARQLLGQRTEADDFERVWQTISPGVARALPAAAATDEEPVEVLLELGVADDQRRFMVRAYRLDEDDCTGHLLLVQSADRAAAGHISLRSAARDRALNSVYRDLAHDMKGALNAMVLNVELLRQSIDSAPGEAARVLQHRCTAVIGKETERLSRALSTLLHGPAHCLLGPSRVDLSSLVCGVGDLVKARCDRQHVELVVEPGAGVAVEGQAEQIHVALLNLVVNALEAMPGGGRLTMSVVPGAAVARLSVSDTGPGIPAGWEKRIWRLHATTKPGGTGIGLHVTRSIVRSHAGTIRYERTPEGVTCFIMELPVARNEGA